MTRCCASTECRTPATAIRRTPSPHRERAREGESRHAGALAAGALFLKELRLWALRGGVVIGRSYGGEVAVDLVQRYPDLVRALVLLEPAVFALSAETLAWGEMLRSEVQAAAAGGAAAASDRL